MGLIRDRKMIFHTIVLVLALVCAQVKAEVPKKLLRSGRYNPQLFGASGWYTPDNRGKYRHIPVPYDGGYGDRGEKYVHDERARYWKQNGLEGSWEVPDSYEDIAPYALSRYNPSASVPSYFPQNWNPGQHEYAGDYNYNQNGWRIIEFQWSKDGKTRYSYLYETESKTLADEISKLAKLNDSTSSNRVDGFFQYDAGDGTVYEVDYVANEHGYYPKGEDVLNSIQNVLNFLMKNSTKTIRS